MADRTLPAETPASGTASKFKDLRLRLLSGLVLAAVALGLTWWNVGAFSVLVGLVTLAMAWEWSGIVRPGSNDKALLLHLAAVLAAVVLSALGYEAMAVAAVAVAAILVMVLASGQHGLMSGLGVAYVGLPAVALIWLRGDTHYGFAAIVFLFLVVWSSDIGAFLAGRLIGGPKLWPRVSPNKTWAGLAGGVAAAALAAALFASLALTIASPSKLAVVGVILALVAQAGDLVESALKRRFGVKDASGLIPGHGGFMDRVDSLVTVAVVAALVGLVADPHAPARALLVGL